MIHLPLIRLGNIHRLISEILIISSLMLLQSVRLYVDKWYKDSKCIDVYEDQVTSISFRSSKIQNTKNLEMETSTVAKRQNDM
jgi:hypothetical protein